MTWALVWWMGLLALTWGLVVLVRAWSWSPDQDDASELRSRGLGARMALLPIVVLLVLAALVSLSLLGWSARPPGWARFREALPILAVGAATGLGVAACLLTMVGHRVRSWWLLTGLIPAGWAAALVLGA
jgi:hypothetical protein